MSAQKKEGKTILCLFWIRKTNHEISAAVRKIWLILIETIENSR